MGFVRSLSDPCLYVHKEDPSNMIVIHVDDGAITGSSREVVDRTKRDLAARFKIRDMGPIKFLLKWEITRDRAARTIHVTQQHYIQKMLEKFNMQNCTPSAIPISVGTTITVDDCPTTADEKREMSKYPYAALVGTLMYLMSCTRPDLAYVVGQLCRVMSNPGMPHWNAAKKVLRYLKGTASEGLTYGGPTCARHVNLIGYTDADWGGEKETARSTSGILILAFGGAVGWASKKQSCAARSTFCAEYVAASETASEVYWLRQVIKDMKQPLHGPSTIYIDNQTALVHLKNNMTTQRSKTINIHFHIVRDHIAAGDVKFEFVPTTSQMADVLTKPVTENALLRSKDMMHVGPCPPPLE
jgi:hypothetical protein